MVWRKLEALRVCPRCNGHGEVDDEKGGKQYCPLCRGAGLLDDDDRPQPDVREPDE
jgi:DnaJ-class molecular chaperone